ncbi:MAG: GMC family oxidoreductase [Bryobacteraceae bacterium]|nr:GMC family oxidoreductase [Bryobacteraceae bacterium]
MANPVFDVCIVGTGPGGGIAAYALTKAGLKVALVERGKRLRAGVDFGAHVNPYAKLEPRLNAGFNGPIPGLFADYQERGHFTPVGDNPRHGQLRALGGRSLCWAGHSLRFGPLDYKQWPVSYDEIAPYYSRAERFMAVYGEKDGLSNMPDGEFQKPVALRCGEQMLKRGVSVLKRKGREMDFVGIRKAIPTEPHASGRTVCHYCGHCMQGCEVDSKYTSANTAIPAAQKTGNLTLFLQTMMTRIVMDRDEARVKGLEYVDNSGKSGELQCKVLVLACSAVETARHLLANRTSRFPNGLANSSGQVGKHLTSHFGVTVVGMFPELHGRDASNDDGTDYYHGLLTGMYWNKPNPNFEGTYQVQCGSGVHPTRLGIRHAPGIGKNLKEQIREWNTCHAGMNMQGSLLVSSRKFVDLDWERKDSFGLPLPRIHLHYEDSDLAMARDMVQVSQEIIRAAGGRVHSTPGEITASNLVIDQNHWVGTTKMGTDPKKSVVNTSSQTHDIPNLFIGDASVFAAYPEKNPTLTNITLSWRMSDHLADKLRKKEV